MDGQLSGTVQGTHAVDAVARHIEQTALDLVAHGHGDGMSGGRHRQMPLKPVGGLHGYGPDGILPYVLLHLEYLFLTVEPVGGLHGYGPDGILPYVLLHLEYLFLTVGTRGRHGLVNARKPVVLPEFREVYVHHRTYDL